MTPERNAAIGTAIGGLAGIIAELNELGDRVTALEDATRKLGPTKPELPPIDFDRIQEIIDRVRENWNGHNPQEKK